jgi:hypothetical protein
MTRIYWRPGGLMVLVAAAAIGLAACSGGSSSDPAVASLPATSSGSASGSPASGGSSPSSGSSASGGATSGATQLLDQWAACMRGIGDTGQTDPTIDSNEVIQILTPMSRPGEENFGDEAHDSTGPCGHYLQQASKLLLGGQPSPPPPSLSQVLEYAKCMRANGVPKYPDPDGSGRTNLLDIDMSSPAFKNADKLCSAKYGLVAPGTPEPPGSIQVGTAGGPPDGSMPNRPANPGAGANG